jgi:putative SOS response-associated peptidase YedK
MCAEYIVKKPDEVAAHIRLYAFGPVIFKSHGKTVKKDMQFSLKPPGTTYPTFNARLSNWDDKARKLVKIQDRPTWRKPLESRRCIIPMTSFIEPIYLGDHAGSAMEFSSPDHPELYAAGLYDTTLDKKTGEVYEGFSIIIHTPTDFILKIGHHRMVVLLDKDDAKKWIGDDLKTAGEAYEFLVEHRFVPKLVAKESRKLSKNWPRKQAEYEKKLAREKEYMKHLA